ncbi:Uncharacterized protein J7T55_000266 [Diaporthe amygdali]|uniref:uncharacterized protein n=1 Tax=Phomopsis amygdali TaxID=1214568 RepID=UPI0022FDDD06|nr:uncharacterized protein J7T55_000266 [Diaporthe amygdali]KAJ0109341.1 Uncharacterized protein J7T55_000266 [Diaporthe amygdali]
MDAQPDGHNQDHDRGVESPPHPELSRSAHLDTASSPPDPDQNLNPHVVLGSPITVPVEGQPSSSSPLDIRSRPALSQASPASSQAKTVVPSGDIEAHIAAYFEYFHPSFPLLHRPTFGNDTPELLRNIITAIGCLYTARTLPEEGALSCIRLSQSLWDTGRRRLARLVGSDWKELRRIWTMQAWLLHIIYGAFMGGASQYKEAKKMLRTGVDAAQDLGLLRQAVATSASQSWIRSYDAPPFEGNDVDTLQGLWMLYVDEESMKLSMYTLLFLDFHISAPCNVRMMTSSLDLDWELPFSIALWEADTAATWSEILGQEPRIQALLGSDETAGPP